MELKEYKLGDIAEIITGVSYTPDDITTSGIRILRGGNIQAETVLLKSDDVFLPMSYANNNQLKKYDTIIVSSTGSVDALAKGATIFEDLPNTQIGAFLRIIRPKEEKYAMIISMWCTSSFFRQYMIKKAKGTSINNIRTDFLTDFPILVPKDNNLEHTSKLYLNLESKLLLNRQINQNLEALARQLYDYWFVQFDFPNEEGKPYKSSGGKMVYNPILKREIPERWEVKKLGELCSINKRTSNGRYNSPILYLDTASITNNNIEMLQFLDPEKDEIPSRARRVVMEGDIVYSTVRPNLKHFGLLYDPKSNMVVSTGFAVITANWSAFRYYIYQFLKQDKVVDNLHSIAQSAVSSYPSINASDIQNLDIVVPSNIQIDAFAHIACKIHAQLEIHAQQILSLTKQRDELLPLLMNGQVNFDLSDD